jgi:Flp pilus assembly protein TadG
MLHRQCHRRGGRPGVAAVEFAILLPLLMFLLLVTIDYCRIYYVTQTINNCARNGALYACDNPTNAVNTAGISSAALADAYNLSPQPTVSSVTGTDADGEYVEVTVACQFQTITTYPGIPSTVNLSRTVHMRVTPVIPDFSVP